MSNMSYCRFENTLPDLRDCYDAWDEDEDELSKSERRARTRILALCRKIVEEYGDES